MSEENMIFRYCSTVHYCTYLSHFDHFPRSQIDNISIRSAINTALVEGHYVLC